MLLSYLAWLLRVCFYITLQHFKFVNCLPVWNLQDGWKHIEYRFQLTWMLHGLSCIYQQMHYKFCKLHCLKMTLNMVKNTLCWSSIISNSSYRWGKSNRDNCEVQRAGNKDLSPDQGSKPLWSGNSIASTTFRNITRLHFWGDIIIIWNQRHAAHNFSSSSLV